MNKFTKTHPENNRFKSYLMAAAGVVMFNFAGMQNVEATQTLHKTIKVQNQDIFYREAGSEHKRTIVLLHGFPTSSHMYRNIIPK